MWEKAILSSSQLFSRGYLYNPEDPRSSPDNFGQPSQPPPRKAAIRLSQMLNTYWAAMNGKNVLTSGLNEVTVWADNTTSWKYQDESQDMTEHGGQNGTKPIYTIG